MGIKILVTGGEIDKAYNEILNGLDYSDTSIQAMLSQARCNLPISVETLFLKDGGDIDAQDREIILTSCTKCDEEKIIITLGLDAIESTGKYLVKNIKNKRLVLFGSTIPYCLKDSEALFNLGCAVTAIHYLDNGVYIAKNGKVIEF